MIQGTLTATEVVFVIVNEVKMRFDPLRGSSRLRGENEISSRWAADLRAAASAIADLGSGKVDNHRTTKVRSTARDRSESGHPP